MQITNGTVEYSRTVKPADYESKAAKVVLTFAVDEGEASPDAVVARVFDMAMAEVHRRLGITVTTTPGLAAAVLKTDVPTAPVETLKALAKTPPAEPVEVRHARRVEAAAAPQENPTPPSPAAVVADITPTAPTSTPAGIDPLAIVAPATAPVSDTVVEITDSDLHTAVHQTLDRGVTAIQVRNLTDTFTGVVGQSMRTLPQDQRPDFLAALKKLQPDV